MFNSFKNNTFELHFNQAQMKSMLVKIKYKIYTNLMINKKEYFNRW